MANSTSNSNFPSKKEYIDLFIARLIPRIKEMGYPINSDLKKRLTLYAADEYEMCIEEGLTPDAERDADAYSL